jgi:hypothetical protein
MIGFIHVFVSDTRVRPHLSHYLGHMDPIIGSLLQSCVEVLIQAQSAHHGNAVHAENDLKIEYVYDLELTRLITLVASCQILSVFGYAEKLPPKQFLAMSQTTCRTNLSLFANA